MSSTAAKRVVRRLRSSSVEPEPLAVSVVPTSSATFTITGERGEYQFSPPEVFVLNGLTTSTVTLVVGGSAPSLPIDAFLVSNNEPYAPFGSWPPYEALPDPGKPYELARDVIQAGYLTVEGEQTAVPGVIVPVRQMWIDDNGFDPPVVDVEEEGFLQLTWKLASPPSGEVEIFDSMDQPFPLFGGTSNSYPVSGEGDVYQTVAKEGLYVIARAGATGVKGTINVKRRTRDDDEE
jgi:hypothetical protein